MTPDWRSLDSVYAELVSAAPASRAWLIEQTLATSVSRRALFSSLPLQAGWRAVDIGCGFGMTTLEWAALGPSTVIGVDLDQPVLDVAAEAARAMGEVGDALSIAGADAYGLPMATGSIDAVLSRFVFQHLEDPTAAAREIRRILRPGGMACIVDVDDGLSISEPPPSPAFDRLAKALRAAQAGRGGDRYIGRRLAAILDAEGLRPLTLLVLPQAAYSKPSPDGPERTLLIQRLAAARPAVVTGGHMDAAQFDADLASLAAEEPGPTCEIEAHLVVIAQRS